MLDTVEDFDRVVRGYTATLYAVAVKKEKKENSRHYSHTLGNFKMEDGFILWRRR
jgi:hypothetical protein